MPGPGGMSLLDMMSDQPAGYVPSGLYGGGRNMAPDANGLFSTAGIPPDLLQAMPPAFAAMPENSGPFNVPTANGMVNSAGLPQFQQGAMTSPGAAGGGFFTRAGVASQPAGAGEQAIGPGGPAAAGQRTFAQRGYANTPGGAVGGMEANLPSTDNWRLLPPPYNTPNYAMRDGHIIDKRQAQNPFNYAMSRGAGEGSGLSSGGYFGPASAGGYGTQATRGYFWPGQVEQWMYPERGL